MRGEENEQLLYTHFSIFYDIYLSQLILAIEISLFISNFVANLPAI